MDGVTEFTNQGGKDPSYDQNKTLLEFHQEGEVPGQGPISLSGGEILGEFVRDDIPSCNQDGEPLQKSTESAGTAMDDATSTTEQQCAELRGILDLGAGAFPSFEGDLFGSPERDLFLSSDGGERSRSYPPSPTAPSFLSKADEPSGLTVLSLEGAMGGLRKAQISHGQLPSSLLTGLESGKEFQTIRLQDPNNSVSNQNEESGEITKAVRNDTPSPNILAERVMMFVDEAVGQDKQLGTSNSGVTATVSDLTMSPILTETMSTAALTKPRSPQKDQNAVDESAEHFPFVDLKNLPSSSSSTVVNLGETFGHNLNNLSLNVANIEEEQSSQMNDGRLIYVITTKDQFSGSLSKIQVTVDPNAIQAIPSDSLTGASGEQWIMGEQILDSGGGGDSMQAAGAQQAIPSTLVFPNQALGPVIDLSQPPQEKKAQPRSKSGKRAAKMDPGTRNMWLKKNQPQRVTVCPHPGCGLKFTSKTKYEGHATTHAVDRPFKCTAEGCEWSFPTNTKLRRHLFSHQGIKPFVCLEKGCGKHFGNHYNLKAHERAHRNAVLLPCGVEGCQEVFPSKKKLQIHLREHFQETRLKCPVPGCEETFMTSNARGSHLRRHCVESPVYKCEFDGCNRTFDKESRLIYHTRSHTGERPYKCTYQGCQWAFTSHQKLKRHECRHTGRKDFRCPLEDCGKTFTRREHLQAHEVAHRGELPFACKEPGCNARFSQRSSLHMHKKRHSSPSGRPGKVFLFSCALGDCNASFSTRQGLKNHVIKGHMDQLPMIDIPPMDTLDNESPSPPAETLSPSNTPSPVSIASSVMSPQPDAASVAMSSAMLSTLDAVSETVQSTMNIQLPEMDQGAISLLSSISLPPPRNPSYPGVGVGTSKTDYCSLGKRSPMFAMSGADSLVQGKDLDVIDSSLLAQSLGSVTSSPVPTSFALTSTSPLTLRDPATGASFIQTQLLQDDPPDDTDITFDLDPPASTSAQSPMHGVLPVSALLGDTDSCPVSTTADFLSSDPGAFEGSTINLQDLA